MKRMLSMEITIIDWLYDLAWKVVDHLEEHRKEAVQRWQGCERGKSNVPGLLEGKDA